MELSDDRQKTIMNVLVFLLTIVSIIIAVNTYHISQNQLQVDKINHQPHFIFQEEMDEYRNFKWLIVSNDGFHVNAIQYCMPVTFFEIEYQKDNSTLYKTFLITGYMDIQWQGDFTNNELIVIGDYGARPHQIDDFYVDYESKSHYETGSNHQLHNARKEIENNVTLQNMSSRLYIKEYVFINYTDVYFEQHQQAYSFDDLYYPILNDEERIRIWNLFFECIEKGHIIDIDDFDMPKLLYILNETDPKGNNSMLIYSFSSDILVTPHS